MIFFMCFFFTTTKNINTTPNKNQIMKYAILALLIIITACDQPASEEPETIEKEPDDQFLKDHPKTVHYSVHITGEDMKSMTLGAIADKWEIPRTDFIDEIERKYGIDGIDENTLMDSLSDKTVYKPKEIKDIAESLKQ